jgi:hypothetical protein
MCNYNDNVWLVDVKFSYDTFSLVINFINQSWVPCHIIVGLFEVPNIFGVTFIEQVKVILGEFNLTNKVIAYVKYEGATLIISQLPSLLLCHIGPLQLP